MHDTDALTEHDDPEKSLEDQAVFWVVRMTSGETTPEERLAFQRWRDENPANAAALADARQLWLALGPGLKANEQRRVRRSQFFHPGPLGALAASIVAFMLVGVPYLQDLGHDYVTARGERRAVTFPDGTHVVMNGGAALDVNFKDGTRKVTLARGEAYFEVVHDAARPFTVTAGNGDVRDVGTAFSVRREADGAMVVVAHGEVKVDLADPGRPHPVLTAGQAVTYGDPGPVVVRKVDASKDLSWVRGQLILENLSLTDSVEVINRFYSGRLLLVNRSAGERRINAVVDLNRVDDWLTALDRTHAAKVTRLGSLVLLY